MTFGFKKTHHRHYGLGLKKRQGHRKMGHKKTHTKHQRSHLQHPPHVQRSQPVSDTGKLGV